MGGDIFCQHVKARFVITKPLLATDREQPKPVPTGKGMNSTKRQQYDRQNQAFAGYFRVNTGRVQPLQIPESHALLYSFPPDFIRHLPNFRAHKN